MMPATWTDIDLTVGCILYSEEHGFGKIIDTVQIINRTDYIVVYLLHPKRIQYDKEGLKKGNIPVRPMSEMHQRLVEFSMSLKNESGPPDLSKMRI